MYVHVNLELLQCYEKRRTGFIMTYTVGVGALLFSLLFKLKICFVPVCCVDLQQQNKCPFINTQLYSIVCIVCMFVYQFTAVWVCCCMHLTHPQPFTSYHPLLKYKICTRWQYEKRQQSAFRGHWGCLGGQCSWLRAGLFSTLDLTVCTCACVCVGHCQLETDKLASICDDDELM